MSDKNKTDKNKTKKISRRTLLLSGLLASLGGIWTYKNWDKIDPLVKLPYSRFIDNKPNIIIIAMDTLRADHLGCYGYHRDISPNIDAFAKDSVLYWNTMSQSNWTLPAFASLFTSLYPHQHATGITHDMEKLVTRSFLPKKFTTLADILSKIGYHTTAVTGGNYVSTSVGLDKGFKEFYQVTKRITVIRNDLPWQMKKTTEWIKKNHWKRKFFLFVHSYECHSPYVAPQKYVDKLDCEYTGPALTKNVVNDMLKKTNPNIKEVTKEIVERYKTLYDAEIMFSDELLGNFFQMLKDKGIYDDSLIIFLSDHGDEFYEHKSWSHSHTMYEELLRVPIIVKYPGGKQTGVNKVRLARLIDIMPTILFDVLGLDDENWLLEGRPLSEQVEDELSLSEAKMSDKEIKLFSFRRGETKYVIDKDRNINKVFDLKEDPFELNNLYKSFENEMDDLVTLSDSAEKLYIENLKEQDSPLKVDENTIEMLKDLGYVQ